MKASNNEARAHHFVPQCWLAGFTQALGHGPKEKKQWRCKPSGAGHHRDFNRVEDPSVKDPLAIENIFSNIESAVAPLLRSLNKEKRGPRNGDELGALLEYMAIQWIRVPTFRALVGRTVFSHLSAKLLSSPQAWKEALH